MVIVFDAKPSTIIIIQSQPRDIANLLKYVYRLADHGMRKTTYSSWYVYCHVYSGHGPVD